MSPRSLQKHGPGLGRSPVPNARPPTPAGAYFTVPDPLLDPPPLDEPPIAPPLGLEPLPIPDPLLDPLPPMEPPIELPLPDVPIPLPLPSSAWRVWSSTCPVAASPFELWYCRRASRVCWSITPLVVPGSNPADFSCSWICWMVVVSRFAELSVLLELEPNVPDDEPDPVVPDEEPEPIVPEEEPLP